MLSRKIARSFAVPIGHAQILILGGGPGGITTAAQLIRKNTVEAANITIVDGAEIHDYRPGWTLYASEYIAKRKIQSPMEKMIPKGVNFVPQYVKSVDPKRNTVVLSDGKELTYDQLVIATGVQMNFNNIKGLSEALEDPDRPVASVYCKEQLEKMHRFRKTKFDVALFTQAPEPVICAGAPQKMVHLTHEAWRKQGFNPRMMFFQADPILFKVDFYGQAMKKILESRGVDHRMGHRLDEVTKDNVAIFDVLAGPEKGKKLEIKFDFLHAVPSMKGRKYLKGSGLEGAEDFIKVDKSNGRSKEYKNVWSIGDSANFPTSKSMSATLDQAVVLVEYLNAELKGSKPKWEYKGYTGCPMLMGDKKVMLAEFQYGAKLANTFLKDQRKPRRVFYWMVRYLFPFANFYLMPRGLWRGHKSLWDSTKNTHTRFQEKETKKYEHIKTKVEGLSWLPI